MHNQELEELRQLHNERVNCKLREGDTQLDHVRQNKLIASEWLNVTREMLKSRQDTSAERYDKVILIPALG